MALLLLASSLVLAAGRVAAQPTFDRTTIPNGFSGDAKMVGDLDGDGFPDVAVAGLGATEPLAWFRWPDWLRTNISTSVQEYSNYGVIADVDRDGDNDLVVPDATITPSNVFWYENPGPAQATNGAAWIEHPIGHTETWCKDVFVRDVDGDGRPDVAARAAGSVRAVKVFFREPAGSWTRVSLEPVSTGSEGLWTDDLDGDGDVDFVVRGAWLENPGGAASRVPANWIEHAIGAAPADFKAFTADIDEDGVLDILYSNSEATGPISLWTTADPRTGPWSETVIEPSAGSVHTLWADDTDRDGDLDVLAASMGAGELRLYENTDGAGGAWTEHVLDPSTASLHNGQVADLGLDGDGDLFGAGFTGQQPPATVWENRLDPRISLDDWTHITVTSAHVRVFGLAFGDVDGDGLDDILSGPFWYRNPGGDLTGAWVQSPFPQAGGEDVDALLVTNVDGDRELDVIAMTGTGGAVWWLERDLGAPGGWTVVPVGDIGVSNHGISAQGYRTGDIVHGGRDEIVLNADPTYVFQVPANPAAGNWPRFAAIAASGTADEEIAVGDVDRDGLDDLVATNGATGEVRWFENPGTGAGNWTGHLAATLSGISFHDRVELGDLDRDGRLDIVVTEENGATSGASTHWLRQPADPTTPWTATEIASQGSTNSLGIADADLDGDLDVITAEHKGSLAVVVWENDGTGSFTPHTVDVGFESHLGARARDLDRDGDLDLLSIAWDTPELLHLWRNDATGPAPDLDPPGIASVSAVENPNQVVVTFDEPVDAVTAGNAGNYSIDHGIGVLGATQSGPTTIALTTGTLQQGVSYLLSFTGVEDLAGNAGTGSAPFAFEELPAAASVVSRWKLDESGGTTATDSAGSHHGTLANGPTWDPAGGHNGGALLFDGTDDRVDLGTMDAGGGTGLTLALWMRPDTIAANDARLISKATSTAAADHWWMLSLSDGAALRVRLKVGGSTTTLIGPAGSAVAGAWQHVAATYDGATLRLWRNAVEIASVALSGAVSTSAAVPVALGAQPQGGNAFDGRLDDVFIYTTALDASGLAALMSLQPGPAGAIFSDGFESGDVSAWSAALP